VAAFFGSEPVHVCSEPGCVAGVVALPPDRPADWPGLRQSAAWLYTTAGEVSAEADPAAVRAAVAALRLT
jgi:hypothetical protein